MLTDRKGNFIAFGHEAESIYLENACDSDRKRNDNNIATNDYMIFRDFMIKLHHAGVSE